MTFNTYEAAKALKSTGFDEKQAETVVETIDKAVNETVATKADLALLAAKMATKDDIKDMATKDDIKDMATKDDLKGLATKDELKALAKTVEDIDKNMATKADLAILTKTVEGIQKNIDENMATRADLANLESRMMRMMLIQTIVLVGLLIPVIAKLLL